MRSMIDLESQSQEMRLKEFGNSQPRVAGDSVLYRSQSRLVSLDNHTLLNRNQSALKQLENENRQLKHVVAELTLDNRALKAAVAKSGEPADAAGGGAGGSSDKPATRCGLME